MSNDPTFKIAGAEFVEFDTGLGETVYLRGDMISGVISNLYTVHVYVGPNMTVKDPSVRMTFGTRGGAQQFATSLIAQITNDKTLLLDSINGALDNIKNVRAEMISILAEVTKGAMGTYELYDNLEDRMKACEDALLEEEKPLTEVEAEADTESEPEKIDDHVDILHMKPNSFVEKVLMIMCCLLLFLLVASIKAPPR